MNKLTKHLIISVGICLTVAASSIFAVVPQLINYQGSLTDAGGGPVADGPYLMRFQIYDDPSAGTTKWSSSIRQVEVSNGHFTYLLGDSVALPDDLFANDTGLWLGVKVSTDAEITPRSRLTSYGYAYQALRTDTAGIAATVYDNAITSAKILDGTVGSSDLDVDAVTSSNIAANAVGNSELAANSVSNSELQTDAVTSNEILDGTISSADLASGSVGNSALQTDAVTSNEILDGTISSADLGSGSVGNSELQTNAVTSSKILNGTISSFDLAEQITLGNPTGLDGRLSLTQDGSLKVVLSIHPTGTAILELYGLNNNRNVILTTVLDRPDHGYLGVGDFNGAVQAGMYVQSDQQGRVFADIIGSKMQNPGKSGTDIWYSSLEGPEAAAYVRGTGQLVNGSASISLPDHFVAMASNVNMTVIVIPLSADSKGLAVVSKSVNGFEVRELNNGTGTYDFDYEFKAVRKGQQNYQVIQSSLEGKSAAEVTQSVEADIPK